MSVRSHAGLEGVPPRVLVANSHPDVLETLRFQLETEDLDTVLVDTPSAALAAIAARELDVALIDLASKHDATPHLEGLELLAAIRALDPDLPVVGITAWGSVEPAEALRLGAGDFVRKPWKKDRLLAVLRNQVALGHARRRSRRLAAENRDLTAAVARTSRGGGRKHIDRGSKPLTLAEAERSLIEQALRSSRGNVSRAARSLDISRGALYRRLEKHGLSPFDVR